MPRITPQKTAAKGQLVEFRTNAVIGTRGRIVGVSSRNHAVVEVSTLRCNRIEIETVAVARWHIQLVDEISGEKFQIRRFI